MAKVAAVADLGPYEGPIPQAATEEAARRIQEIAKAAAQKGADLLANAVPTQAPAVCVSHNSVVESEPSIRFLIQQLLHSLVPHDVVDLWANIIFLILALVMLWFTYRTYDWIRNLWVNGGEASQQQQGRSHRITVTTPPVDYLNTYS